MTLQLTVFSRLTNCTSILPNDHKHISKINFTLYPIIALSHVVMFILILTPPSPCKTHAVYTEHLVATYLEPR